MIRVMRGEEPAGLAEVRASGLEAARRAIRAGEPPELDGYQVAKVPLWQSQHMKCCWCEDKLGHEHQDVEHYRPKRPYWWLTWTWENLLFACAACNRSHKGRAFPLEPGSSRLPPEEQPPGRELPVILDPAVEDPEEHISFRCICGHWIPVARDGSRRGAETIRILGLDRMELMRRYDEHAGRIARTLERTQPARRAEEIEDLCDATALFSALTRAVLAR